MDTIKTVKGKTVKSGKTAKSAVPKVRLGKPADKKPTVNR